MVDIVGSHLDEMNHQDKCNAEYRLKTNASLPNLASVETSIIAAKTVLSLFKTSHHKQLKDQMVVKAMCTLFHLSDAQMGIDSTGVMGCKKKSKEQCKFIKNISLCFPAGVFTFKRLGNQSDWTMVSRMEKGDSASSQKFAGFVKDATAQAPVLLSR
eukprot:14466787-Ditylum_brightwellii.AAC.1